MNFSQPLKSQLKSTSLLIKSIRNFTNSAKFPKGALGKEGSLGNNFSFPRHKEMFTEGYYEGENDEVDEGEYFESPISKQLNS